jgi:hypothetical protein
MLVGDTGIEPVTSSVSGTRRVSGTGRSRALGLVSATPRSPTTRGGRGRMPRRCYTGCYTARSSVRPNPAPSCDGTHAHADERAVDRLDGAGHSRSAMRVEYWQDREDETTRTDAAEVAVGHAGAGPLLPHCRVDWACRTDNRKHALGSRHRIVGRSPCRRNPLEHRSPERSASDAQPAAG